MGMIQRTFYSTEEQLRALKKLKWALRKHEKNLKRRKGITLNELVREALELLLEKYRIMLEN